MDNNREGNDGKGSSSSEEEEPDFAQSRVEAFVNEHEESLGKQIFEAANLPQVRKSIRIPFSEG